MLEYNASHTYREDQIIHLLQSANKSLSKAITLMEFITGEKLKEDKDRHNR